MQREGVTAARCTIERLMRHLRLAGAVRGKRRLRTTVADELEQRPTVLINRVFAAARPSELWATDFTRAATSISGELTLDALGQALYPGRIDHLEASPGNRGRFNPACIVTVNR